jgi:hypothetical protein
MIEEAIENCNGIVEKFKNDKLEKSGGGKLRMIDMTPNQLNTEVKEVLSDYSDNIMWNLYEKHFKIKIINFYFKILYFN